MKTRSVRGRSPIGLATIVLLASILSACNAPPETAPKQPSGEVGFLEGASHTETLGPGALGIAAAGGYLYAALPNDHAVQLFDAENQKMAQRLTLPNNGVPGDVRAFIDRSAIGVLDTQNQMLNLYRPALENKLIHQIAVDGTPGDLSYAFDNRCLTVPRAGDKGALTFYFNEHDRTKAFDKLNVAYGLGAQSKPPFIDFEGTRAVQDSTGPLPDDHRLLVGGEGGFRMVTAKTGEIKTLIPDAKTGGPVIFGQIEGREIAAVLAEPGNGGKIHVMDLATNEVTTIPDTGSAPIHAIIDQNKARAYVAMADTNEVVAIDYQSKRLVKRYPMGGKPVAMIMAPPTPSEVWIACDDGTLSIIGGSTATIDTRFKLGPGDHRITFWGSLGYVTNSGDGTMTVINRNRYRQ